jgi:RadC-like JAB domain-containing protein
MRVLLLDSKGQLVEKVSLYQGTTNSSVLRAAEIFRPAVIRNCPGHTLCHDHPSGDPTPSLEDIQAHLPDQTMEEMTVQVCPPSTVLSTDEELAEGELLAHPTWSETKSRWETF